MGIAPGGAWVTERGTLVPNWTPNHNPETDVRMDGKPLGFKVKDMLPERRWAVDEFGHVLDLRDFKDQYQRWFASHSKKEDPILVAVPDRLEFVSGTYDRDNRPAFINFDPGDPGVVKPSEKYDHKGEIFVSTKEDAQQSETRGALKVLAALKKAGKLTAEEYAERVLLLTAEDEAPVAAPEQPLHDPVEADAVAAEVTVEGVAEALSGDILTPREREVIEFVGRRGTITQEMAEKAGEHLSMQPQTVRAVASKARNKLFQAGR